ncbi:hypothetical protein C0992_008493, partial [Termitomyces sp. T32_za158]
MTSTSSSNPPIFPEELQFNGTNYVNFKSRVLIAARAHGAKGYLDGMIKRPEDPPADTPPTTERQTTKPDPDTVDTKSTTEPTKWNSKTPSSDEWDLRDAWTLALIVYNCKNPVGLGIKMNGTAAEAWKTLTDAYGVVSKLAAMGAENRLRATTLKDGGDFVAHIADLQMKWTEATERGATVSDATF